jgi:tRNA pseudouridine55 synthase
VAKVRRLAGQRRVGHAGTLDPLAEGVLPVLLGRATRLADFVQMGSKTYVTTITLGSATATDDAEGEVIASAPVPPLSAEIVEESLAQFRGEIQQIPPKYSALKVDGHRAYAIARAGGDVSLAQRTITVHGLRLLEMAPARLDLEVDCSRGTYIRALARDIACALGTLGYMASLVRTRVGAFPIDAAVTPEHLAAHGVLASLLPPSRAIPDAPAEHVSVDDARRLQNGQAVSATPGLRAESVWVYDPDDQLICLAAAEGGRLRPRICL